MVDISSMSSVVEYNRLKWVQNAGNFLSHFFIMFSYLYVLVRLKPMYDHSRAEVPAIWSMFK